MAPHFVTVYQVTADPRTVLAPGVAEPFFVGSLILIAIVIVALSFAFHFWRKRHDWKQLRWLFAICIGAASFIFIPMFLVACMLRTADNQTLDAERDGVRMLQTGDYYEAEGLVTDFDPMPSEGHKNECFSVQAVHFCYSDYMILPGFHNAASHGGPIRTGLQVRIAYRTFNEQNTILRLEVLQN